MRRKFVKEVGRFEHLSDGGEHFGEVDAQVPPGRFQFDGAAREAFGARRVVVLSIGAVHQEQGEIAVRRGVRGESPHGVVQQAQRFRAPARGDADLGKVVDGGGIVRREFEEAPVGGDGFLKVRPLSGDRPAPDGGGVVGRRLCVAAGGRQQGLRVNAGRRVLRLLKTDRQVRSARREFVSALQGCDRRRRPPARKIQLAEFQQVIRIIREPAHGLGQKRLGGGDIALAREDFADQVAQMHAAASLGKLGEVARRQCPRVAPDRVAHGRPNRQRRQQGATQRRDPPHPASEDLRRSLLDGALQTRPGGPDHQRDPHRRRVEQALGHEHVDQQKRLTRQGVRRRKTDDEDAPDAATTGRMQCNQQQPRSRKEAGRRVALQRRTNRHKGVDRVIRQKTRGIRRQDRVTPEHRHGRPEARRRVSFAEHVSRSEPRPADAEPSCAGFITRRQVHDEHHGGQRCRADQAAPPGHARSRVRALREPPVPPEAQRRNDDKDGDAAFLAEKRDRRPERQHRRTDPRLSGVRRDPRRGVRPAMLPQNRHDDADQRQDLRAPDDVGDGLDVDRMHGEPRRRGEASRVAEVQPTRHREHAETGKHVKHDVRYVKRRGSRPEGASFPRIRLHRQRAVKNIKFFARVGSRPVRLGPRPPPRLRRVEGRVGQDDRNVVVGEPVAQRRQVRADGEGENDPRGTTAPCGGRCERPRFVLPARARSAHQNRTFMFSVRTRNAQRSATSSMRFEVGLPAP
ncbi:MAG: hypothetical protein FLDDKLPJ_00035 [Phycisphaerae bacterium]|nr:hypothetical protein [Phycisphaerae bacterium]